MALREEEQEQGRRWLRAAEVEFLAEEELVSVVPKFEEAALELVGGTYGPFIPQTPVQVPLWLAVALRQQQRCQVQCPAWMKRDALAHVKSLEKSSSTSALQVLPRHYMEVAALLLQHAAEDVEDVHQVRSLLEDIENLRQHKIRVGLNKMAEEQAQEPLYFLKLNRASAMEINAIRPLLLETLATFHRFYADGERAIADALRLQQHLEEEEEELELEQEAIAAQTAASERAAAAAARRASVPASQGSLQHTQATYDSDDDLLAAVTQDDDDDDNDDGAGANGGAGAGAPARDLRG